MLAQPLALWLKGRGVHYGWVIVFITFVTLLTTAGAMGLPGALIKPLTGEFGWSVAEISQALSVRLVLFGLIAPFAAGLLDRYGVRNVVLFAVSIIGGALLLARFMTQFWHLMLLWGIVVGVGTGMTALVLGAVISGRWFTRSRGLVLGFLTASSATGQLAFLPLATWLVENFGWRSALLPTVGGLAVVAALIILFMRDRPADIGLPPYGETALVPAAPPLGNAFARTLSILGEVSGHPTFWILAATFFICGLSTNGLVQQHFIAFCGDYGMAAVEAGIVLAMMGAFDFVGTIASGWLSDRVDNRWLLFWYYGLRGLSLLYLPFANFSITGLSVFAAFYGLDWIATVPPTVKLTAATFGREKAGIVFGWVFASHMIGAAVAAYGAGLSKTVLATYLPAFYAAGGLCLVAAGLCLLINRPLAAAAAPMGAAARA